MPRPVWTGSLSFGLVNVPVKAFTATRDHSVHFHQLEKGTGARIRNQRVSEKTGKQVDADDIEMGYELRKGRYVTFDKDELADLKPESTRAVEVTDFVALEDIDPMFYERTYWLAPADDHAKEAYQLLHAAMVERGRVGIGTVVMRNNQYLTAIRPIDNALAMSTMHFADEIVDRSDIDGLPTRRTKPSPKAMKLATQIVDALSSDWKPQQYHDTYTEELEGIIAKKDKGKADVVEESGTTEPRADVGDLMAALEASISKSGRKSSSRRSSRPATKKGTASGTTTKRKARAKAS
jgi:DNA end-binding protein Ku